MPGGTLGERLFSGDDFAAAIRAAVGTHLMGAPRLPALRARVEGGQCERVMRTAEVAPAF